MKYNTPLALSLFLIVIGCKQAPNQVTTNPWSTLTITSEDNEVITIDNMDDTSIARYYDRGGFFTGYHKVKVDSLKPYFTMAEKDTLYKLAKDIIANPVQPKRGCTEFVGDLQLVIDYGQFKNPGSYRQSVAYSGVCNWNTLSDKTMQLHKILKRKIKGVYLGENDQN